MSALRRFFFRLLMLFSRQRADAELDREIAAHLALLEEEFIARGLSLSAARRASLLALGGPEQTKEHHRDARSFVWLDDAWRDLHYAARALRRSPAFTVVAVLTLALGIGANTAVFSVINTVLIHPLPFAEADRLVRIVENATTANRGVVQRLAGLTAYEVDAISAESKTLSHIGFYNPVSMTVNARDESTRVDGAQASAAVLSMLGVQPIVGRLLEQREETPGNDGVIVLSDRLWRRYFSGNPDLSTATLILDGRNYLVVGVMPPDFSFPDPETAFWVPFVLPASGPAMLARRAPIARLRDGVSIRAAVDEINLLLPRVQDRAGSVVPPPPPPPGATLPPLAEADTTTFDLVRVQDQIVDPLRPALVVIATAIGFVLLVACANVANLLLARMGARRREMAIRLAIGASRGRVVRQVLTESVWLSLLGGLAGVALAVGGIRLLQTIGAALPRRDLQGVAGITIPRLGNVSVDGTAIIFTAVISIVTGVLFGLIPALRPARSHDANLLRDSGAAGSGFNLFRPQRIQGLLVVAQIAMAVILVVAGGLLIRSFVKLSNVHPGYDAADVLTLRVSLPRGAGSVNQLDFAEEVAARFEAFTGAKSAGYAQGLPMVQLLREARLRTTPEPAAIAPPPPSAPGSPRWQPGAANVRPVSRDFLTVMGVRLIAGRMFGENDGPGEPRAMLINRTMARSGFLGTDPIGQLVYMNTGAPWAIVGIVDDIRQFGLDREPDPQIFIDVRQMPPPFVLGDSTYFAVRTGGDSGSVARNLRALVQQVDPRATIDNVATMEQIVANSIFRPRLYAVVMGVFAAIALLVATVGVYGLIAYTVAQRTKEIGIRIAVGAQRRDVAALVLGEGLWLTLAGVSVGLLGAMALTKLLDKLLFGLSPLDPITFAVAALAFTAVAVVATLIPAHRASRVDPIIALRCD